jgi:hypothetical protein
VVVFDKPHHRRQSKALLIKATKLVSDVLRHLNTSNDNLLDRPPATFERLLRAVLCEVETALIQPKISSSRGRS